MNTERMEPFWLKSARLTPKTVVDGASAHVANALRVPEKIRLHRLPRYAPELNPQEHLWDERREKEFPNRVFSDRSGVVRT